MTKEEMKNKCTERAKIFQQAMESCHSSSPIDCIEWFADRIADLEEENAELNTQLSDVHKCFISASSSDDFEMAESAREVMEVLNIRCYRHGEVKSKLTKAKEIIKEFVEWATWQGNSKCPSFRSIQDKAEQFISEVEK